MLVKFLFHIRDKYITDRSTGRNRKKLLCICEERISISNATARSMRAAPPENTFEGCTISERGRGCATFAHTGFVRRYVYKNLNAGIATSGRVSKLNKTASSVSAYDVVFCRYSATEMIR